MFYQGAPRHYGEHPLSYENQQFSYAGANSTSHNPVHTTPTTRLGSRMRARAPRILVPGPPTGTNLRGPPPCGISQANPCLVTIGARANSGTMPHHGPTGTAVAPKPRPLPGNMPTALAVGPPTCLQHATTPLNSIAYGDFGIFLKKLKNGKLA